MLDGGYCELLKAAYCTGVVFHKSIRTLINTSPRTLINNGDLTSNPMEIFVLNVANMLFSTCGLMTSSLGIMIMGFFFEWTRIFVT